MREPLKLQLTAPPARLPVDLNELRAQLRLDDDQTAEDAILLANLRSATEACESFTRRSLISQTWTLFRDAWPGAELGAPLQDAWREGPLEKSSARALVLPRPPLQSVVHVKTFAEDDTEALWPASAYFVDAAGLPGRLVARAGQAFPAPGRAANGIEVRFVAGHGDTPGDVPARLRQGIVQLAAYLFENRGDNAAEAALSASGAAALWRPLAVARL
jgi:uncharacterized phiE125 gp8 family phage protein